MDQLKLPAQLSRPVALKIHTNLNSTFSLCQMFQTHFVRGARIEGLHRPYLPVWLLLMT
jgi:hypothetical protein